jgi:transglutaminase-like putative cysteine protease
VEALIDGLGWVGFDPVNDVCPTDAYVRVAVGLDYLGAAPIRGVFQGGDNEGVAVAISVVPDGRGGA